MEKDFFPLISPKKQQKVKYLFFFFIILEN